MRRTHYWNKLSKQVLRSRPTCAICGTAEAAEVDHITPISRGGSMYKLDNLQPVCKPCHYAKTTGENRQTRIRNRYRTVQPDGSIRPTGEYRLWQQHTHVLRRKSARQH